MHFVLYLLQYFHFQLSLGTGAAIGSANNIARYISDIITSTSD